MGATYVNSSDLNCTVNICYDVYIMHYALITKILQGGDTASGMFSTKGVVELVVKTRDKYTYKEVLKILF